MNEKHGVFTVSLDFELYWGVRDKRSIEQYKYNLLGVRKAIPEILQKFDEHKVHATWATVGFLFFDNSYDLIKSFPRKLPEYKRGTLSPYNYIMKSTDLEDVHHLLQISSN